MKVNAGRTVDLECAPDGSLVLEERNHRLRLVFSCAAVAVPITVTTAQSMAGVWTWKGLAGAAAGFAGLTALALVLSDLRVRFDAGTRTVSWERRNAFRTRRVTLPFDDVRDVFVLSSASRDDDSTVGGYSVHHKAMLRTATQSLPLSLAESIDKAHAEALCAEVLSYLTRAGAEVKARTPVERLLLAGRLIDAVSLIRTERGVDLAKAREIAASIQDRIRTAVEPPKS